MSYAFARRPRWIAAHIAILLLVLTMIGLGFWQIDRLHQKQAIKRQILARRHLPAEPVEAVTKGHPISDVRYRTVTAHGTFVADQQLLVRDRPLQGAPGYWVVTPLRLDDGSEQLVLRGWISLEVGSKGARVGELAPPAGAVTVTGGLMQNESGGPLQKAVAAETGDVFSRIDSVGLGRVLGTPLRTGFVQLTALSPKVSGGSATVSPVPLPEPDEGPHLSYAIQWFIFTAIAIGGYPLILRRQARQTSGSHRQEPPGWELAE